MAVQMKTGYQVEWTTVAEVAGPGLFDENTNRFGLTLWQQGEDHIGYPEWRDIEHVEVRLAPDHTEEEADAMVRIHFRDAVAER